MCMRHDDRARLQLPDVGILPVAHQGPKETPLLIVVVNQGKTNKDGHVQVSAAMRHKDNPMQCPHFALARLWHFRWVVQQRSNNCPDLKATELRLNMDPVRPWFDSYVNPGYEKSGNKMVQSKPINYRTCLLDMKHALSSIPHPVMNPSHYTHIERKSVICMGEMHIGEEQLRRAGHWRGSGRFHESYLVGIPYDFLRHVAGHGGMGSVFIVRAELDPPQALLRQVFPFVGRLKLQKQRTAAARGWEWCTENDQFIDLMDHLALVMLQDVAVLWEDVQVHTI